MSSPGRVGRGPAFWIVAATLVLFLFAAAAPSPLYAVYAAKWRFSPAALTEVFAIYAIALLVALLLTGSLSDAVGRRPVILAALGIQVASMFDVPLRHGYQLALCGPSRAGHSDRHGDQPARGIVRRSPATRAPKPCSHRQQRHAAIGSCSWSTGVVGPGPVRAGSSSPHLLAHAPRLRPRRNRRRTDGRACPTARPPSIGAACRRRAGG